MTHEKFYKVSENHLNALKFNLGELPIGYNKVAPLMDHISNTFCFVKDNPDGIACERNETNTLRCGGC